MDHTDATNPPRWRRGPLHAGVLKSRPDDFRVEEIPAYEPSGFGEHVFVRIEKVDLTTPEAVKRLCRAVDAPFKSAGWAGMKDRHAVTTQWLSLHGTTPEAVAAAEVDGVTILDAIPHEKKLKTGHLRGNRFELRVREVTDPDALVAAFGEIDVVPSYFGEQRFGRDNLERAAAWLVDGGRSPRDRVQKRFLVSALQAAVFNSVVARRVRDQTLTTVVDGDVLQTQRGGLFDAAEDDDPQSRLDAGEVTPTAPLPGNDVRWATGNALTMEQAACAAWSVDEAAMARMGKLGRGTRRATFLRPLALEAARDRDDVRVTFSLPSGCYATVVVREALDEAPERPNTP
ncbi:MAG: tRNA pseudouridine(13) synthase TruD [Deltaproteobacteria bacterium]|nr:tRNA pseudouridine(13) synthase TruD [Deltaproteobacteria bacterium]